MDSDKAAVWVTNWDTERNGSSLTTRDGTSYLLANAFMLAYDYGQPHIFSGYYYAGVDDGAPGATRTSVSDMTCPTDGIETAGTWHCAQRWTAIRGMIGFRNAVAGTFTATVAKGSAVALYAGATPANWAGTRKYDPSDPAWFTGETPHKNSVEQVSKENENVQVSRLLEIVDCTETKISVRLRKELKSENLNAPFLDISSIGEFYLSDKAMQNFDSIRDMEDYVEKRLDFLVDKVQMEAYLSQLIANVTGSFGNAPVVILSE